MARPSRGRLTVSARLVAAVAIPTVALVAIGLRVLSDRHDDVREADRVQERVLAIDRLIELRVALFAERVGWELLVPERRPPTDVLQTTDFGRLVLDDSAPLEAATDSALLALAPHERPFTADELAAVRADAAEWAGSPATIRERLEPFALRTEENMAQLATEVRNAAVELGDWDLIAAGTTFQRSIRLPQDAAEIIAALSDLWAADPADRPALQSEVAAQLSKYTTASQSFESSIVDPDGAVAEFWEGPMQVPPAMQDLLDRVGAGELSIPERAAGEPVAVGLVLLEAIDWTIEADRLPLIAADAMIDEAAVVADEARSAERTTAALVFTAIAVSIAGAVLFGRSIVAPVRRLTDHARSVGGGDLDLDPLPLGGPPDVAVASAAMNDVVGSLRLLEEQSRALADVDLDHTSLREPLPGDLGATLQRSTEVLSASIAEREDLRAQLQHDATHDSLTGLANRAALSAAVADLRERDGDSWDAAIVFVDLDGFKQIRNRLGLGTGEEVLRVVARRITALAPDGSTVARLGGDEFLVLLTGSASAGRATEHAREVVDAVGTPIEVDGQVLHLRACAGVATVDEAAARLPGPSDLLQRADLAVHDAKQAGPGTVVRYDAELGRRVARQHDIEVALAAALDSGAGLHLLYQPIVSTATGALSGMEALVRWDRDGVVVRPDEFVPTAERSGLITRLDRWVLRSAAAQMATWSEVPWLAEVPVSVNVSGRTLQQPGFVEDVGAVLESSSVAADRLVLEVTETALVTDLGIAAAQLEQLRSTGVRVAIDDFGTGYTSIAQLRALPVDELKIDGSFVRNLPDTSDWVLVRMIQDVADLLGLATVAEGVETSEQVDSLTVLGCNSLQGYLFSRPIDADAVVGWAEARPPASGDPAPRPVRARSADGHRGAVGATMDGAPGRDGPDGIPPAGARRRV